MNRNRNDSTVSQLLMKALPEPDRSADAFPLSRETVIGCISNGSTALCGRLLFVHRAMAVGITALEDRDDELAGRERHRSVELTATQHS